LKKKLILMFSCIVLVLSSGQVYAAKESETVTLYSKNDAFDVISSTNNGVNMYTINSEVKNKGEAAKVLNDFVSTKSQDNNIASMASITPMAIGNWYCGSQVTKTGISKLNSDAKMTTKVSDCNYENVWAVPLPTEGRRVNAGTQQAIWLGSYPAPYYADKIVVHQKTTYTGVSLTFTWPPALTKTGSTISWQSDPVEDVYLLNVDRLGSEVYTSPFVPAATPTAKVEDSADFYIGTNIYRAEIKVDFTTLHNY